MPQPIAEKTAPLAEAGTTTTSGRMRVQAISAGVGSSGYYSPTVLEQAATDKLIAKGTPLHLDHASESERHDRPERSVTTIAAVFTEDATYDAATEAIVGEIQVFAPYRDLLTEMAPYIGLSISGSATDVVEGVHDGRTVPVIEGLHSIDSVDFVTRAGRGGRVVDLLESTRTNRRALAHDGVSEATVNDTREALQTILRDTHGSDTEDHRVWVWVRDFDDSTVWFEIDSSDDNAGLYAQDYTQAANGAVTLTGDRTEVRVVTTYVPVTRPGSTTDSSSTATEESEEDTTMPEKKIEESEYQRLVEDAGRVTALEERATTAEAALAARDRTDTARRIVEAHDTAFTPLEARGLLADLPVVAEGDTAGALDETAFKARVDEAAAEAKVAAGHGRVSGFGQTTDHPTGGQSATESSRRSKSAWGRPLTEQKGA